MKKLLLLLFLIPNMVMAESFYLICDGEAQLKDGKKDIKFKRKIGVEVNDEFIEVEGTIIKKNDKEQLDSYKKDKNRISFFQINPVAAGAVRNISGDIDRISGHFTYENEFKAISYYEFFSGVCKKGKKAL